MHLNVQATLLAVAAVTAANPVHEASRVELAPRAVTSHYLFSFGDSYSQTDFNTVGTQPNCSNPLGNPPIGSGTTSGGINWIGTIAQTAPTCFMDWNFASGGATINATLIPGGPGSQSFKDQVTAFTRTIGKRPTGYNWTSADSAAAVWFGVNDASFAFNKANNATLRDLDIGYYFVQLTNLYNAGVRKFLLLNIPPVDRTPLAIGQGRDYTGPLHTFITAWNVEMAKQAASWASAHAGSSVQILDVQPIFAYILDNTTQYGSPDNYCCSAKKGTPLTPCDSNDGPGCLWWNGFHPSTAIQKAVGVAAYGKLFGSGSLGLAEED